MRPFAISAVAMILLTGLTGCRSSGRSGDTAANTRDPLLGKYIPKQDLPIPGRDSAGNRRDPLYAAPASNSRSPETSREPYRNTKGTTTAGLSGRRTVDDEGMSIDDRRPAVQPASRGVPLRPGASSTTGESWEQLAEELNRLRARYTTPVREANGDFVMTADVPGSNGALRRYEGVGPTAAAAAKQLLEQIK